jgi:hypothetical protein
MMARMMMTLTPAGNTRKARGFFMKADAAWGPFSPDLLRV